MATMKALPWAQFFANGRRYTADGEGSIEGVIPTDVAALTSAGAIVVEPYSHKPEPPPTPSKPPERLPTVWVKGPPGMAFAPVSGSPIRYRANGEGYFKCFPEHVAPLRAAGCTVIGPDKPAKQTSNAHSEGSPA